MIETLPQHSAAAEVAHCLNPSPEFTFGIKRVLYENVVSRLQRCLNDKGIFATQHEIDNARRELQAARVHASPRLSPERLCSALEVLELLQDSGEISRKASVKEACSISRRKVAGDESTVMSSYDTAYTEPTEDGIPDTAKSTTKASVLYLPPVSNSFASNTASYVHALWSLQPRIVANL